MTDHTPPTARDFHGRAATLLNASAGVSQQEAIVALADAATGLLGLCLDINERDEQIRSDADRLAERDSQMHQVQFVANGLRALATDEGNRFAEQLENIITGTGGE